MQPQVAGHPATKTPTPSHNLFSTCTLPITISHDLTTKSYPRPKARPTWRSQDSARGILYHFFESFHTALHRRWGRDGHKAGFRVRYPADRIGNQGRRTRASGLYHIERDCAPSLARGGRRGARRLGRLNELVVDHLVPPQSQFGGFGGDGKQSVTALVWFGEGWIDLPLRALAGFPQLHHQYGQRQLLAGDNVWWEKEKQNQTSAAMVDTYPPRQRLWRHLAFDCPR